MTPACHGQCDGCLEDVDLPIHVDVDERFDPSHGRDVDPFGESNVLTGERLDVADLAQQSRPERPADGAALPAGVPRSLRDLRGESKYERMLVPARLSL